jgi:hypothetical protein
MRLAYEKTRSNFSKNRTLFPIFGLDGQPAWAIVPRYDCPCCNALIHANDGELLASLLDYMACCYPVAPRYAKGKSHVSKTATDVFETLMVTYGNGDLVSRLLYSAINQDFLSRITSYYSIWKHNGQGKSPLKFLEKDGEFLVLYPPTGETFRNSYDDAASSTCTIKKTSEKERNMREIQAVKCSRSFAQDHTHDVVKNYQHRLGAFAMWDVATETGEVATSVLVKTTKTRDFAHAA